MKKRKRRKPRGNCYVTCEALYHLLGGAEAFLVPHTVRHEGDVHWYLVREVDYPLGRGIGTLMCRDILDPTASQFKTTPDYSKGRGRGFLTKGPSKRAKALMKVLVWQ